MGKKITVIVPVYNTKKFLTRCVNSILKQSYENLEVIIIDDGSTDGSAQVCDELSKSDKRVRVIHQKNKGIATTRNIGIENATGYYISFVDSDDYLEKDLYKNLIENNESESNILIFDYEICDVNGKLVHNPLLANENNLEKRRQFYSNEKLLHLIWNEKLFCYLWSMLIPKKLFENVRFPDGRLYEDEAVFYKIFMVSDGAEYIPYKGYHYVQHNSSITKTLRNKDMWDRVETYEEAEDYIAQLPDELKVDFKKHKESILLMCYCTLAKLEKNSKKMKKLRQEILKDKDYLTSDEKVKRILLELNFLHIIFNLKGKMEKKR